MPLETGKCPLGAKEPLAENPYSTLRSRATLFMRPFPELLRTVNGFYTLCNNLLAFNIASFQLDLYVLISPSLSGHKFLEGRDHLLFIFYKPLITYWPSETTRFNLLTLNINLTCLCYLFMLIVEKNFKTEKDKTWTWWSSG